MVNVNDGKHIGTALLRLNKVGRIEAIDFEPITAAILTHWRSPEIDWEKVVLSELNKEQAESGMGFEYYY